MKDKIKKSYAQGLTSRSIVLPRPFLNKFKISDKVKISLHKDHILITKAFDNDFWMMGIEYKSIIDENNNYFRRLTTLSSGSQSVTIPKEFLKELYIKDDDFLKISSLGDEGITLSKAKKEDVFKNESL